MTGTGEPVNMVFMALNRKRLEERLSKQKFKGSKAPLDHPIYSQGWQVGSAPVFRESKISPPDDSDKENQPHPGLVPPIDLNARPETGPVELKDDGSNLQEFLDNYSPVIARNERRERGEE